VEYFNKILCVTFSELTTGKDAVITGGTLLKNVTRGNIASVRRGGGEGSQALYAWSSLPKKYKKRFVAKYGDPEEIMKETMVKETVKMDSEARAWYEDYTYEKNGQTEHLTDKLIEEYTLNASVIGELLKLMARRRSICHSLNAGAAGMWEVVFQSSERMREQYGHTLPASEPRLKSKIKAFKKRGYGALVSRKVGNRNTVKITKEFGRMLIALKRSRVPVYTDSMLFEEANRRAVEYGWKPLKSMRGMVTWLNRPDVAPLWWDAVHGEQAARLKFGRKHKTVLPTKRDALWYGDGTKLNLYYRDAKGQVRTTQVYEVVDAMSEVLLGYHISDSENFEAQYHAFRMAIETSGHKPYEIAHDNQGGHKKLNSLSPAPSRRRGSAKADKEEGFLDRICHVHRATMPYNGSSKTIESIFGRFQQQVLSRYNNFTGQNVTAKKEKSKPNMEMVETNKDRLPTLKELKEIYAEARKTWNEMPLPGTDERRIDVYNNSVNEKTEKVGKYELEDMFWLMSRKPVTFTDQGISLTIDGRRYCWEVFDEDGQPDFAWRREHTWEKFHVRFDPDDMTSVVLYRIDSAGDLRRDRVARPYLEIHRALQDQSAEEKTMIHASIDALKQDRIERVVAGRRIAVAHGTDPEQNGLNYPKLKGLTAEQNAQVQEHVWRFSLSSLEDKKDATVVPFSFGSEMKALSNRDWREEMCAKL
jgi:hypothetical protein